MMDRAILKFFVILSVICVLVNDLLIVYDAIALNGFGTYESTIVILLSISVMIAIPSSVFLLVYGYTIRKTNQRASIFLMIISGFYIAVLLKAWVESFGTQNTL